MLNRTNPAHSLGRKRASGPLRLQVVPVSNGWQLLDASADRAMETFATQSEALEAAQVKLGASGGELRVQGTNGRWKESFTLGSVAMTKLAAVEGIIFTPEMKRRIKAAQNANLSPIEREKLLRHGLEKDAD